MCAAFFIPDELVSLGKVSGGLYELLLENPSWLYQYVIFSENLLIPSKKWEHTLTLTAFILTF